MKNLQSEIRKLKLAHGNRLNSIESKKESLIIWNRRLEGLYRNPVRNADKIESVEKQIQEVW